MKELCDICLNARVTEDLTDKNDLAYYTVDYYNNDRMMIRSGGGKPLAILAERYSEATGWQTVSSYNPKFCPNCGRELFEYKRK